ncbi:hypothetical protein R1sor_011573 [Riccia sorocarpa]|uniref:Uncharacterized protein n=1 Tax=Riccia sorocarpa TaxID=122646 RepID=A0ABD3GXW7_9MARC
MPRLSERQAMLGDLERLMELKAVADIVWSSSSSDSDSEIDSNGSLKSVGLGEGNDLNDAESTSSSSDDEEDMLIEMYCQIIGNRYLHRPERQWSMLG